MGMLEPSGRAQFFGQPHPKRGNYAQNFWARIGPGLTTKQLCLSPLKSAVSCPCASGGTVEECLD